MHYKVEYLEHKGRVRVPSIPKRLADGRVYVPGNPIAEHLTTFFWSLFLRKRVVKGLENLDKAMGAYCETTPLTLVGPHVSDADTLLLEQAVRREGRSDFANRFVYISGLNMEERWYICINTQGGNRIFVETPFVLEDLEEVLNSDQELPSRELLTDHLEAGKLLNRAALREVVNARKRRQVLVLYPQSTRSSDGLIQRGHPMTEVYLKDGVILPFMVRGSAKFLPPKQFPPVWQWIWPGGKVDVEFGEPFLAKETRAEVFGSLSEMNANFVDLVMAQIASLGWERMNPDIRPFHQKLYEKYPVVPLTPKVSSKTRLPG